MKTSFNLQLFYQLIERLKITTQVYAYIPLAKGGRYDHIGEVFGRRRGATGFDIVLNGLSGRPELTPDKKKTVIAIKNKEATEQSRWEKVQSLREQGYIVIESGDLREEFDFELVYESTEWNLRKVECE